MVCPVVLEPHRKAAGPLWPLLGERLYGYVIAGKYLNTAQDDRPVQFAALSTLDFRNSDSKSPTLRMVRLPIVVSHWKHDLSTRLLLVGQRTHCVDEIDGILELHSAATGKRRVPTHRVTGYRHDLHFVKNYRLEIRK